MIHIKIKHLFTILLVLSTPTDCSKPETRNFLPPITEPAFNDNTTSNTTYLPIIQKKTLSAWLAPYEYYTYAAQPDQQRDFRLMANAGTVIVSGSQAHQPQGMEFLNSTFIHYGLGNLFFDQYDVSTACRQGVIDLHTFYDGRHINTKFFPIQFIDYARPRQMTNEEANDFFMILFQSSGW